MELEGLAVAAGEDAVVGGWEGRCRQKVPNKLWEAWHMALSPNLILAHKMVFSEYQLCG